ncbi:MAG: isoprenylcysteine carboxylmethyltransferase family protein [Actinomycetales bacterium]|nr:isoprenylcysteine carboxylmethyltransferase family protein [Actinomycetales bacterium]
MSNKTRGNLLVTVQFVLLIALVAVPAGTLWPFPEWLAILALIAMLGGVMIALFALVGLGKAATATPVPKEGAPLRTNGLYAAVRHPIYSGLLAAGLGLTLRGDSVWHIVIFAGLIVLLSLKSRWEERMLVAVHPEYATYAAKVGRFMPGIGKLKG